MRPPSPVVVRGLGRHLELQEAAKRQRAEQEEREAKVFIRHPSPSPRQHYTIPQPFNLTHEVRGIILIIMLMPVQ
jgi:hypothetical protein